MKDHFFIIEFQGKGSQHDHAFLWIKDALVYERNVNVEIEDFVDT